MRRLMKAVLGLALVTAMMITMTLLVFAENPSIQVNGHIEVNGNVAQYRITYNANGGTGSYTGSDVTAGGTDTVCTLSATGITRSGYTFTAWNTAANGSGTAYDAGYTVTLNSDITLYAQWTKTAATAVKTGDADITPLVTLLFVSMCGMLLWKECREKSND